MENKKIRRENFRLKVLKRDSYRCIMYGFKPDNPDDLDSHHICDRLFMPFGGSIPSNGICLCTDRSASSPDCHRKAESLNEKGIAIPGYSPADLYAKIMSSYEDAYHASLEDQNQFMPLNWLKLILLDFEIAKQEEFRICKTLGSFPTVETWNLSCEEIGISNSLIKMYGEGRRYAIDDGAKKCN